jgi:hypothetical protein
MLLVLLDQNPKCLRNSASHTCTLWQRTCGSNLFLGMLAPGARFTYTFIFHVFWRPRSRFKTRSKIWVMDRQESDYNYLMLRGDVHFRGALSQLGLYLLRIAPVGRDWAVLAGLRIEALHLPSVDGAGAAVHKSLQCELHQ